MICDNIEKCVAVQVGELASVMCVNDAKKCIEVSDRRSEVKCEERKKKYILENTRRNQVILYKMDGGVIVQDKSVQAGTAKCDYLFVISGEKREAILTELKGVDVSHSLDQLSGTLTQYKKFFDKFDHVYEKAVVSASTPNIKASPRYTNLCKRIKNNFGGNIKIYERQKKEKDIDLSK